ncbi:hypothetical protein FQN54_005895 [Arachnomyces sp. PD_36]|nr:hypothetical protein FQN54_005895 [Arachnomyces sp. PD_36]
MSTPGDLQALFASIRPRAAQASPAGGSSSNAPQATNTDGNHFQHQQGLPIRQSYNAQGNGSSHHLQAGFHQPSVSSPIYSPQPVNGTPPHHGSDVISPNVPTPHNESQQQQQQQSLDQTANLLNLLKFSSNNSSVPTHQNLETVMPSQGQEGARGGVSASHGRGISASDLVASFRVKPTLSGAQGTKSPTSLEENAGPSTAAQGQSTDEAQKLLLRLLNRPKPTHTQSGESEKVAGKFPEVDTHLRSPEFGAGGHETSSSVEHKFTPPSTAEAKESPMRMFGFNEKPESTAFEASKQPTSAKETLFTYVNPFEQLAAASPRNQTPQQVKSRSTSAKAVPTVESAKGKRDRAQDEGPDGSNAVSPSPEPASKRPSIRNDEDVTIPSNVVGADTVVATESKRETVSEALGGVAEKVDKQVEDALARAADEDQTQVKQEPEAESSEKKTFEELSHKFQETTIDKGKAPEKASREGSSSETPSPPYEAESAKEMSGDAADGGLAESWENVEEPPEKYEPERVVRVFNFPLKPFVSITLKGESEAMVFPRDDGIMDVARLKKDFDQLDRSLTSATSDYIVYALTKQMGGMRVIRQDDGVDKQVFRATHDRIFNVSVCTTAANSRGTKEQAVLGVGVSGAVYWATISKPDNDLFERDALDSESLIFPPFPASDENTSGGQLKTRARRSSCHPEFFAIGRGKSIHIVWPKHAMSSKYGVTPSNRKVDSEKFFKDRLMKITTGKAGKDFIFSEDDTVIASLDKTGRIRFWDIREMLDGSKPDGPMDIRVPLRTLVTGSPAEKSWPTSVLFIDKLRPYVKSIALRYILVGLKQNHTLQLWDIGLGKAVQELNLSHENESDAICSVAYHPGSGILVIGHPTRNCIYFVHLSAPRYSLPPMSQATYIQRLADQDEKLPKPESTACMSGIREMSFASKGQLRSLELLPLTKGPGAQRTAEEESGLFELYVMHSRGVTCVNIRKDDLGWNKENKITHPVNALEEGRIEINDLQELPPQVSDTRSVNGETQSQTTTKSAGKESVKKGLDFGLESSAGLESSRTHSPAKPSPKKKAGETEPQEAAAASASNGFEKVDKRKKKKGGDNTPVKAKESVNHNNTKTSTTQSSSNTDRRTTPQKVLTKDSDQSEWTTVPETSRSANTMGSYIPPTSQATTFGETTHLGVTSEVLNKEVKNMEKNIATEFSKALSSELGTLYQRFNDDRHAQDAAANAKMDAVLRLISSTLSDNVEKNLARIINTNIQTVVVPKISELTGTALDEKIGETVTRQLSQLIPHEIRNVLPEVISRAIQRPEVLKNISDIIGHKISLHVENEFSKILHSTISPAFKNLAIHSAEKMGSEMEHRLNKQLKQYEIQRHNDSVKIDQLTALVRGLSDTVASMASAQTGFQTEILKLNRRMISHTEQLDRERQTPGKASASSFHTNPSEDASTAPPPAPVAPAAPSPPHSAEQIELAEIDQLMRAGKYEDASLRWLHSTQQADLFDNFFVKCNPAYLSSLSPIITLSIGVAVTASLETSVQQRLHWLETVLHNVDLRDPDILEVAPKIMDVLIQRLEALYMHVAEKNPHEPLLRQIPPLTRRARELRDFQ